MEAISARWLGRGNSRCKGPEVGRGSQRALKSHTQAGVLVTNSASVFLDEPKNYLITEASSVLNLKCGTKRNVTGDRISFNSEARRQELSVSSKFRIVGQE